MPHEPSTALLSAALDAAEHGWPVFPLVPGQKRPAVRAWEQRATTDPVRIWQCWTAGPYNIGLATGPAALVVVDLDMPKNKSKSDAPCGAATLTALCERAGQAVPATRTVRTASGGTHLYFTAPEDARLSNSAGKLGPFIDTRAHGGYVVAPRSVVSGATYTVTDDAPVVPLPTWLHTALMPAPVIRTPFRAPSARDASAYAAAALRNEAANVASAPEGTRNQALMRAARALGRLVASGDLARGVVEEALKAGGESAGLLPRECDPVITSALNWSIAHNPGRAA
jgi:hypothetical protein